MATTSPYSRNTSSSSGVILRQCPRCDYASSQKSNLTRHFESIHITFKCRECQTATYTGRKTIIDHVKRNHKGANEKYDFKDASSEDDRALYHSLQKMGGTAAGTPKVENVSPVCPSSPASSDSERLQHLTGSHSSSRIRKRQLPPPSARDNKGFITKIVAAANLDVDSDHRMHVLGTAGSAGEERIIEEDVEFTIDKEIEEYDFQSLICSSVNPIRRFACPYCAGRFDCGSSLAKHMTADHGIVAKFTQGKGNRYKITEGDAAISLLPQEKTEAVNTSINSSPFKVPKLKKKKKAPQKTFTKATGLAADLDGHPSYGWDSSVLARTALSHNVQHSTGTSVVMEQQPLYHGDEIVDKKCEDSSTTTGEGGERANGSDDDSVSEQDDNKEIGKAFVAQRKKKKKYKKRNMITEEKPYLTADNGSYYYVWPSEAEVASSLPVEPATMDVRRTLRKEGDIALAERQIISDAYSASHADPVRYEMCFQAAMNKMMNFNFVVHENDHGSSKHESNCVIKSHH